MTDDVVADGEVEAREEVFVRETNQLQQGLRLPRALPQLGTEARLAAVEEVEERGEGGAAGPGQADGLPLSLSEAA